MRWRREGVGRHFGDRDFKLGGWEFAKGWEDEVDANARCESRRNIPVAGPGCGSVEISSRGARHESSKGAKYHCAKYSTTTVLGC